MFSTLRWTLLATITIAGTLGTVALAQRPIQPFVVAIIQGSHLLPIARFTGSEWVNTWPSPVDTTYPNLSLSEVPIEWLGKALPRAWHVWFMNGKHVVVSAKEVHGGGSGGGGCTFPRMIGLTARLEVPANLHDDHHHGVAVDNGSQTVASVHKLSVRSTAASPLARRALQLFAKYERSAVDRTSWLGDQERASLLNRLPSTPVTVDWLYRTGSGASTTYYFEAGKWFEDPGTWSRVVVAGWLFQSVPQEFSLASAGIDPETTPPALNEGLTVSGYVPLGVLRLRSSNIWVVEIPLGETTSFALLDVQPGLVRELIRTEAGGC